MVWTNLCFSFLFVAIVAAVSHNAIGSGIANRFILPLLILQLYKSKAATGVYRPLFFASKPIWYDNDLEARELSSPNIIRVVVFPSFHLVKAKVQTQLRFSPWEIPLLCSNKDKHWSDKVGSIMWWGKCQGFWTNPQIQMTVARNARWAVPYLAQWPCLPCFFLCKIIIIWLMMGASSFKKWASVGG